MEENSLHLRSEKKDYNLIHLVYILISLSQFYLYLFPFFRLISDVKPNIRNFPIIHTNSFFCVLWNLSSNWTRLNCLEALLFHL